MGVQTLRESLRDFFAQGTREECLQLVNSPNEWKAIEHFEKAEELSEIALNTLWSPQCYVENEVERVQRLVKDNDVFTKNDALSVCAFRLRLLLFSHGLEQIEQRLNRLPLSNRKRRSRAIDEIATDCGESSRKNIERMSKRAKSYLTLTKQGGLGCLLSMGTLIPSWDKFTVPEIIRFGKYIKSQSEKLNSLAARVILLGLQTYGWTDAQIAVSKSCLMKLVRQYSNSEEDENVILSARDVSQASASEISDEESGVGSVQSRCLTPSGRTSCQQPFKRRKMTTRHSSQVIVSSKTLAPQPVSSICDKRQSDAWAAFAASNPSPEPPIPIEMEVPDTAQSIRYAMEGNIDGLKDLFSKGFASPRDVSITRRFSLVRWALYGGMCRYETVQFLLGQGAFVDEESYQHTWDYAYRKKCTSEELQELKCILFNPEICRDWVEEQRFHPIHEIIFGRNDRSLRDELHGNPNAVHVKDSMGRTALDWATALARLSEMRLLIEYRSPVDTMDIWGRTTVLHAVDSHNEEALRIILDAGANPNPSVPVGLFRSSPLTAASFGGLVGMIKLLLQVGAEVDACNPEGRTALLTAITYNNHTVLRLFIERCNPNRLMELQLLPVIAKSANAETISILSSSDALKKTLIQQILTDRSSLASSQSILRSRTDYDARLHIAFEQLFTVDVSTCCNPSIDESVQEDLGPSLPVGQGSGNGLITSLQALSGLPYADQLSGTATTSLGCPLDRSYRSDFELFHTRAKFTTDGACPITYQYEGNDSEGQIEDMCLRAPFILFDTMDGHGQSASVVDRVGYQDSDQPADDGMAELSLHGIMQSNATYT